MNYLKIASAALAAFVMVGCSDKKGDCCGKSETCCEKKDAACCESVVAQRVSPRFTAQADAVALIEPQAVIIADKPAETVGEDGKPAEKPTPTWSRRLELPFRVNVEKANAKFTNGILRIELPKAEATGVKKITIQ